MLKVSSTEVQNNFGKYLLLANEQDIIVTRNGQEVACLSGLKAQKGGFSMVSERALADGYGLGRASYEEFLELTRDSTERYELIDGEVFLQNLGVQPLGTGGHSVAHISITLVAVKPAQGNFLAI